MPDKNDGLMKLVIVAAICCAVLLCSSVFVAAFKLGTHLLAWWVIVAFQIFLTVCGAAAFSIAVSWALVGWSMCVTAERIAALSRKHEEAIAKLQKRTPTFVVAAALVTQLVMVFADKAFGEDVLTVVTVTILLILLFWFGNEFMLRESKGMQIVGWAFWFAAVLFLPVAIMLHRHVDLSGLWMEFRKIPLRSQMALLLGTAVTAAAPFVVNR
jgi:hypothetical protein